MLDRIVSRVLPAVAVLALIVLTFSSQAATGQEGDSNAQTVTAVGLDARTRGNSAESLGIIDGCTAVAVGDTFPVDVFVTSVENLLGWEVYIQYDRLRLQVVERDVALFLSNEPASNVIDVSDPLPNRNGLYRVAAADIANPVALESGSGVLARLTFQAKTNGATPVSLAFLDYNNDDVYDLGPRLIGPKGSELGDTDGDGFFDGPVGSGRVVVGSSCATAPTVIEPSPSSSPGSTPASPSTETPPPDSSQATPEASPGDGGGEEVVSGRETPGADRTPLPVTDEPQDPGGSASILPWMLAIIGALGILGLLLALTSLLQRRRGI